MELEHFLGLSPEELAMYDPGTDILVEEITRIVDNEILQELLALSLSDQWEFVAKLDNAQYSENPLLVTQVAKNYPLEKFLSKRISSYALNCDIINDTPTGKYAT